MLALAFSTHCEAYSYMGLILKSSTNYDVGVYFTKQNVLVSTARGRQNNYVIRSVNVSIFERISYGHLSNALFKYSEKKRRLKA